MKYINAIELLNFIHEHIQMLSEEDRVQDGRWVLLPDSFQMQEDVENGNYLFECSVCHASNLSDFRTRVPYCWHCGTHMLGKYYEDGSKIALVCE